MARLISAEAEEDLKEIDLLPHMHMMADHTKEKASTCTSNPRQGGTIFDRILENSSKSHMKSNVFLHVFNDISTYVYVLTEYFLHSFRALNSI